MTSFSVTPVLNNPGFRSILFMRLSIFHWNGNLISFPVFIINYLSLSKYFHHPYKVGPFALRCENSGKYFKIMLLVLDLFHKKFSFLQYKHPTLFRTLFRTSPLRFMTSFSVTPAFFKLKS